MNSIGGFGLIYSLVVMVNKNPCKDFVWRGHGLWASEIPHCISKVELLVLAVQCKYLCDLGGKVQKAS